MRREKKGDDTMILTNPQDSILEKARLYQKELKASFPLCVSVVFPFYGNKGRMKCRQNIQKVLKWKLLRRL
jgi:hypothetical protein